MKILSLFDGMACGYIAMLGAGVQVDRYVAFEIDKYAIKTSSHNFPNIEHKGDVFTADFTEYQDFDFLVGGSPCTYWSIAQKNGRETEASGMGWELFQQYVRALHEAKPKYFIYENNKSMSKAIRASIDEAFGFEAVLINSALVSAQNRQRLYWVGRRNADGTYSKVNVEQPIDRGILLKDILDGNTWKEKSGCIDANYFKGGNFTSPKKQSGQRLCVAEKVFENNEPPYGYNLSFDEKSWESIKRCAEHLKSVWGEACKEPVNATADGKSQTIKAQYQQNNEDNFIVYAGGTFGASGVAEPIRVGALPRPNGELSTSQAMRVCSTDGKSVNLTSGGGGMGGKTGLYAVPICHTIPQEVKVRKYTCDLDKFQKLLRERKKACGLSNKDIARKFNKPQTEVEHWFRTDSCFSVPDADIWYPLKDFLKIVTPEFDAFVTVFETREGVFEKSDRCYDVSGKMSTVMTGKTDNVIIPIYYGAIPVEFDGDVPIKAISQADGKTYWVHKVESGLITIKGKQYPIKLANGYYIIRKLTVRECMRLQTVPEWYEFPVSDSRAYRLLGNGWTCLVIEHLIKSCLAGKVDDFAEQIKFF